MSRLAIILILSAPAFLPGVALAASEVQVIGEMRRMFTAQDIRPNVDLASVTKKPHLYGLGPLAGLHGEITVLDGEVYVSDASTGQPTVAIDPNAKAVFLVH